MRLSSFLGTGNYGETTFLDDLLFDRSAERKAQDFEEDRPAETP